MKGKCQKYFVLKSRACGGTNERFVVVESVTRFMTHWCHSKLDAFEISAKSQTPQIGTYALEHNVLQNQTLPVAHTGESSRIRLCLDEGDPNSCQCNI